MAQLSSHDGMEVVDRGPDWLFIRLHPTADFATLADDLWRLLERHFIYRLVLEMDEIEMFPSQLLGQLVMLHKRVLQHDGALRLCGLNHSCEQALHLCRLDQALPHYHCREDAVYGCDHLKPR